MCAGDVARGRDGTVNLDVEVRIDLARVREGLRLVCQLERVLFDMHEEALASSALSELHELLAQQRDAYCLALGIPPDDHEDINGTPPGDHDDINGSSESSDDQDQDTDVNWAQVLRTAYRGRV